MVLKVIVYGFKGDSLWGGQGEPSEIGISQA